MDSSEIRDYTAQFGGGDSAQGVLDAQEIRRKELLATTKITGWFAWLLFAEMAGGVISMCMTVATTFGGGGFDAFLAHPLLGGTDLLTGVFLLVLGFVAPVKAWRRSADAVFYLRLYMAYCLILNVVGLFTGADVSTAERFSRGITVRWIVWPLIWLAYTYKSVQVADVFPKDYRRVPVSAVVVAALLFAIPAMTFGMGWLRARSMSANWDRPEFQQSALATGEYTEGHIVLTAPDGVEVSHDGPTGMYTPLSVRKGDEFSGAIAAGMFTSNDEKTFDAIRDNSRDSSLSFAKESSVKTMFEPILDDARCGIRSFIRVKSVRLVDDEIDVFWRFAVIYAPQHSKAVILSFYDKGNDGYFWKLVKSVRFTPSGCAAGRGGR